MKIDGEAQSKPTASAAPVAAEAPAKQARPAPGTDASADPAGKLLMTPAVRRILREHNLDISAIPSTGKVMPEHRFEVLIRILTLAKGNRLLKEDVERYLESQANGAKPAAKVGTPASAVIEPATPASAQPSTPVKPTFVGEDRVEQINKLAFVLAMDFFKRDLDRLNMFQNMRAERIG